MDIGVTSHVTFLVVSFLAVLAQLRAIPVPTRCQMYDAYFAKPPRSSVIMYLENYYVIYQCMPGHRFATTTEGIMWCNWSSGAWSGNAGVCIEIFDYKNPCQADPCQNGGECRTSEDPYGWGFYCYCGPLYGGRKCQVEKPCETMPCPVGSAYCLRSYTTDDARYCYTKDWRLLNAPQNL